MTPTDTKSTVLLKHHLKALKLPTMTAECEKIAQRCAADNADHLAFLLQLCELELLERERKAARAAFESRSHSRRRSCSTSSTSRLVPASTSRCFWN